MEFHVLIWAEFVYTNSGIGLKKHRILLAKSWKIILDLPKKGWIFIVNLAGHPDNDDCWYHRQKWRNFKWWVFSKYERKKFNTFAAADIMHFQWEYEIRYRGSEIQILIGNISCNPVMNALIIYLHIICKQLIIFLLNCKTAAV